MSKIILSEQYQRPAKLYLITSLLVVSLCISTTVDGYDWTSNYGVNATLGRDDNFRLSEDNPVATTSTSLGVYADLGGATEISSFRFAVGAGGTNYTESSIESSENYYLSLATARQGVRWSGTFNLSYNWEPTTETELLDTGKIVDGQRNAVNVAPGVSYQVNERNSIFSNLSISDVTYDTVSFTEYTDTAIYVGWVYSLSETSRVSLNGNVSEYDPDDADTTNISGTNIGYDFSTSDVTSYSLRLGYSDADTPTGSNRDGNSSFSINHSLDDRNNFLFFVGTGFDASGSGEVRYTKSLNMTWGHALTERMQFTLATEGVKTDDRDYIEITAGANHQYTREINFAANLRYRNQQSDGNDASSSSIFFSLSYSPI